jgi:uncharacterized protein YjbI with pentapeptide repeats
MHDASITGAWMNLISLVGADLNGANLSGSVIFGADLTGAKLSDAKLNGVNLVGTNLSGADLRGADLTGAILIVPKPPGSSANFTYDSLTGSDLLLALNQTEMAKALADQRVADLTEVRLKPLIVDAILQGVIYDQNTIWPVGYDIPPSAILK